MKHSKIKLHPLRFWITSLILACLGVIIVWWILPTVIITPKETMQQDLAVELGVKIHDYPYPSSFPSGYFYSVLKPGMPLSDVHDIVRGYESVMRCEDTREVYYYFSSHVDGATRFQLRYDESGKFVRFEGEEDDSRTLHLSGCVPGLIGE